MSSTRPDERLVEDVAMAQLQELGFVTRSEDDLDEATEHLTAGSTFLLGRLRRALLRVNDEMPAGVVEDVIRVLSSPPSPDALAGNQWLHRQMIEGVEVEYRDPASGEVRSRRARLVDLDDPLANDWLVVRQMVVGTTHGGTIRPDVTVFLNGLPVAVFEFKSPTDARADLEKAIEQLERYASSSPALFTSNVLSVVSDGLTSRVGSVVGRRSRFMPWRLMGEDRQSLDAVVRDLFEPERFLDYMRSCVVFAQTERGDTTKMLAGHHQFRAMVRARANVIEHLQPPFGEGDGRGGVVWHTQGAGKSFTMLILAGTLVREPLLANPTVVVVTDRNDLDDQLFGTFAAGRSLLRQHPERATSREDLRRLLDRPTGGVVFTTIHKFTSAGGPVSPRSNVIVIADEAHRSQYGFIDGGARWMREALPHATFVGFTGTPLELSDRSTSQVFGDYTDIYDIRQAVEDGTTKPIYYESRIVKLSIDEAGMAAAESALATALAADDLGTDAPPDVRISLEGLVGAPGRIDRLAEFIVTHWEERCQVIEGKGMIVTMSRDIAARLYEAIGQLRPTWVDPDDEGGSLKVVMTGTADDEEHIRPHVRSKAARTRLANRFKDPDDDLRLVIVVDMWLTGFDCPPAHTMYLDKPLAGHNLMQAIARVNRVYADKPGGLVVDLLGLADQLADALAVYASAGGTGQAVRSVQRDALPLMREAFEKLVDFFHGFDYTAALGAEPSEVLSLHLDAVDHVLAQTDGRNRYRKLVKELATAFALVAPHPEAGAIVEHLAFFQRVDTMIRKRLGEAGEQAAARGDGIDAAVRQVVGTTVDAHDVIDLFAAAGLDDARLDILGDEFLQRVAALEQKHLALETLRKLLDDEIRVTERTNIVQSRRFRDALEQALQSYTNRAITTAEVIVRLIDLAQLIREARQQGQEMGLTREEVAFYDALAESGSALEVMSSATLRDLARELADMVRSMPKLDWTERESVRAGLRRSVRRLLARRGYPPDLAEGATQLVLRQAELSTDAFSSAE